MTKFIKGGKKGKKSKKIQPEKKNMVFREEDEEYAKVTKMLGNGRLLALLKDGTEKMCIIPGRMKRKKTWINVDDILLVSKRDYQNDKLDVIFVYSINQVQTLNSMKQLPQVFEKNINDINDIGGNLESNVVFTNDIEDLDEIEKKPNNSIIDSKLDENIENLSDSDDEINLEDI